MSFFEIWEFIIRISGPLCRSFIGIFKILQGERLIAQAEKNLKIYFLVCCSIDKGKSNYSQIILRIHSRENINCRETFLALLCNKILYIFAKVYKLILFWNFDRKAFWDKRALETPNIKNKSLKRYMKIAKYELFINQKILTSYQ